MRIQSLRQWRNGCRVLAQYEPELLTMPELAMPALTGRLGEAVMARWLLWPAPSLGPGLC